VTSKYEKSFVSMFDGLDAMIRATENAHHRKILLNYRRHGLLEVSQRWEEILSPEMTVDNPRYLMNDHRGGETLNGREAVKNFYVGLISSGAIVMWPTDQFIAVADWGFASEATFHHFIPGAILADMGDAIDDVKATYLVKRYYAMIWHYDVSARLIGEHVYETKEGREVIKVDPEDVISPARARELLAPLFNTAPV
jgi:hypothetical protein